MARLEQERVDLRNDLDAIQRNADLPARRRRSAKVIGPRSAENDAARLRGLPAVSRHGRSGAMHGTDPLRALLAKEQGSRRR